MTWGEYRQILVQGAGRGLPLSIINTALNLGLERVQAAFAWPRTDRQFIVSLAAPAIAGSVSVVNGSSAVTGSSTSWTAAMNGWRFRVVGGLEYYTVVVTDSTHLTLDRPYEGVTASGKSSRLAQWYVQAQEMTLQIRTLVSSQGGMMRPSTSAEIEALDPHRTRIEAYPSLWYLIADTTNRAPQNLELQQMGFWPEVNAAQSIVVTAPERVIKCSDDTTDMSPPVWMHDGALLQAALLALMQLSPEITRERIDARLATVMYEAAIAGMKAEANRQATSRTLRGSPQSENPCRNIF